MNESSSSRTEYFDYYPRPAQHGHEQQQEVLLSQLDHHYTQLRTAIILNQPIQQPKDELLNTIHSLQQTQLISQQEFPLKLDRKRSRQKSDHHDHHNPKSARSNQSSSSFLESSSQFQHHQFTNYQSSTATNALHLSLPELAYQLPSDDLTNSLNDPVDSSAAADRPTKFRFGEEDLHSSSRISTEPYTFTSPSIPTRIGSSNPIPGLERRGSGPGQDDEMMMADGINQMPIDSSSSSVTTRSRTGTIESQQLEPGGFETLAEEINEDQDTSMDHPPLLPSPLSPTPIHPSLTDPILVSSSSSTTIPSTTTISSRTDDLIILPPSRVPSPPVNRQMGAASAGVSDLLAAQFEPIFTNWLGRLCSDLDMKDSKGESIHQTLMARKMQRLEESADFRPFKFRIQAFTNSFFEELVRNGFNEKDLPMKKVRQYLWSQSCISRFNEEGKKAKSKGNHVWHIEAKKMMNGQWRFLHFQRKIIGTPLIPEAYVGIKWTWTAKVWDPQCSAQNIKATFSSPSLNDDDDGCQLPDWLSWRGNTLSGIPPQNHLGRSFRIRVIAITNHLSKHSNLELSFQISVKSPEEMVTTRKKRKSSESEIHADSTIPQSSTEPASEDTTPTQSPPDLSNLLSHGSSTILEGIPNGMLITSSSDGNRSTGAYNSQLPSLSRTDSSESVSISSPSLEDPPRPGGPITFDGILTESNCLIRDIRSTALKEGGNLEFDSVHAADVLNGMMANTPTPTTTTLTDVVVDRLANLSAENNNNNNHNHNNNILHLVSPLQVVGKNQSIDLSSVTHHSLGSLHLDHEPQIGMRMSTQTQPKPNNLLSNGEGHMSTDLTDIDMIISSSNPALVASTLEPSSSGTGEMTSRVGGVILEQIMSPSQLMPPSSMVVSNKLKSVNCSTDLVVGRLINPSELIGGPPPTSTSITIVPSLSASSSSSSINNDPRVSLPSTELSSAEVTTRMMIEEAVQIHEVVVQQQAVALHEARLQTVRENLMSPDTFISDSAGNLIRTAIVSDDPIARQFAADVLGPMTSSTSTAPSTVNTTTTTTTSTGNGVVAGSTTFPTITSPAISKSTASTTNPNLITCNTTVSLPPPPPPTPATPSLNIPIPSSNKPSSSNDGLGFVIDNNNLNHLHINHHLNLHSNLIPITLLHPNPNPNSSSSSSSSSSSTL
ncbi:hypothetical protein PSTG_04837 [Puccinia striiformis f. sp. tritici PST-78]|uniref:Uncharacterized protein n=1 Tax=Puccinia striiformis f. sp. tritici PST-78 TaxID=1165861 RepID=A0A0L0VRX1_9BASI|nr:hypothetical protein PSTG_04837 [Puccinia striiformis f. sp. tritici PST-78]